VNYLLTFVVLLLAFRAAFALVPRPGRRPPDQLPMPTTFQGFLNSPLPLVADGVQVTSGGGLCMVLNSAAARRALARVPVPGE
jgi:hypothetical protein